MQLDDAVGLPGILATKHSRVAEELAASDATSKLDTHFLAVRCQVPTEAGPCPHSLAQRPQAAVS